MDFPVTTETSSTPQHEILVQEYANRVFVLISELGGSPGTFLEAKSEENIQELETGTTYDVKVLFGMESDSVLLAARTFVEQLKDSLNGKSLLLSLAFKNASKGIIHKREDLLKISKEISEMLQRMRSSCESSNSVANSKDLF